MILDHSNGCSELQFGQHGIFGKQMQGGKGRVTKPTSEGIFEIYGFNMSQTLTEERPQKLFNNLETKVPQLGLPEYFVRYIHSH